MRTHMFVTVLKIYGIIHPEYSKFCGRPVCLLMSTYGTMLCGKYWYLDLMEYLLELGFKASESMRCLFICINADGDRTSILNYVDDMLYYGTNVANLAEIEERLI
jgi:hypothetical protein